MPRRFCLGAHPAAEAADILDTACIDNVSFGWLTVALLARDWGFGEVEIIVRDRDLIAARDTLASAGFRLCNDQFCDQLTDRRRPFLGGGDSAAPFMSPEELYSSNRPNKNHQPPAAHFHLDVHYEFCYVLKLYKKSSILRCIPVLEDDPRNDDPSCVWFSNDRRLPAPAPPDEHGPSGPWNALGPVRILSPATFVEVLTMLRCRDCGLPRELGWRQMWTQLALAQVQLDRPLRPDFKDVWEAAGDFFVRGVGAQDPLPKLSDLRRRLIADGEILAEELPIVMTFGCIGGPQSARGFDLEFKRA
ncbi:uncharacterized protein DSM5745_09830 [Aspergillus mulundensis]|uniref:Uncharacterized protein n=1 Tax=Aspergillus mulundensis TaxID=1810919 RepID=A0A3D8QRI1_9EURO|nr:hypothetical protein DSM5745_09830 [Aspergillus mulundensis]RDW64419.1 hypothetical protein DSM5745_09830 [Aspergillus mulundensis]